MIRFKKNEKIKLWSSTSAVRIFLVDEETGQITMKTAAKLSPEERQAVDELRELVADDLSPYYDTDFNLLRWLKGHNNKLDEILPKLRNHLIFRNSHWQLDSMADKPRDQPVHSYWQAGMTGESGKIPNAFINVEQTGTNDYWGMLQTFPLNEIMKARIYDLEVMLRTVMEKEAKTGEQASIVYIMDLNGLTFDKRLMTLLTGALSSISSFMTEHYIELVHSFVLVNAPSFISAIWRIVHPILPERTRNKVQIFGHSWRQDVLEIANPDVLPAYWNIPGESEVFHANLLRAVPLPVSGYYKGGMLDERAKVLPVSAGKVGFVERIGEEGQKLKWVFEADGHFAYGIYYCKDPGEVDITKMICVYPRFNKVPGPTYVPLKDEIIMPHSGTYKFWFSNEHAWFHTLKIRHFIHSE
uniref:CRAL-TRIO domain-containing protein n=1 Tax=Panagrolaimus sp. JU765 TaxID=591449 RepID=A0AC34QEN0_9BILA